MSVYFYHIFVCTSLITLYIADELPILRSQDAQTTQKAYFWSKLRAVQRQFRHEVSKELHFTEGQVTGNVGLGELNDALGLVQHLHGWCTVSCSRLRYS